MTKRLALLLGLLPFALAPIDAALPEPPEDVPPSKPDPEPPPEKPSRRERKDRRKKLRSVKAGRCAR